jgi:hypothetical protein
VGDEWSVDAWLRRNGFRLRHEDGANTAASYARNVSAATGECLGGPLSLGAGSWCNLRRLFAIAPATANHSRLAFVPKPGGASYTAQVTVPDGLVTAVLFSVCPTYVLTPQGGGVLVGLLTPLVMADFGTVLAVVSTGGLCDQTLAVGLTPGVTSQVFVARCPGAARQTLSLFRLSGGVAYACPAAQDVDLTALPVQNVGNARLQDLNYAQLVASDDTLLRLQTFEAAQVAQEAALLAGFTEAFRYNALAFNASFFEPYLAAARNVSLGPAWPPVAARPNVGIHIDTSDLERLNLQYSAATQAAYDALQNRLAQAADVTARAAALQSDNTKRLQQLQNDANVLDTIGKLAVRSYYANVERTVGQINGLLDLAYGPGTGASVGLVPGLLVDVPPALPLFSNFSGALLGAALQDNATRAVFGAAVRRQAQQVVDDVLAFGALRPKEAIPLVIVLSVLCGVLWGYVLAANKIYGHSYCSVAACRACACPRCPGYSAREWCCRARAGQSRARLSENDGL